MTTPTREQVPNNLAATVYVFRDKTTGAVYATYADGAPNALDDSGLEHIATLEPRAWIAAHFDDFTAGRDQGIREAKEVCEGRSIFRYLPANHFEIERSTEARECAAAIEKLRGK